MKVGVVGTSNTVRRGGFVDGININYGVDASRIGAIGASLGMLYPLFLDDLTAFDCCIMDFSVNEETYLATGAVSAQVVEEYLRGCIGRIWSDRCLPVVLLLPRQSSSSTRSSVRDLYHKLCAKINIPFFDGIKVIDQIQVEFGVDRDLLFEDDGHLHTWLAFELGRDLGVWLEKLGQRPWAEKAMSWTAHVYTYKSVRDFTLINARTVQLSSSLIAHDMACLEAESSVQIEVEADDEAVGITTSLMDTEAVVELSGCPPVLYDLSSAYPMLDEGGFLLSVQAFPRPSQPSRGRFILRVAKRQNINTDQVPTLIPQAAYARRRDRAIIGGLIVRKVNPVQIFTCPRDYSEGAGYSTIDPRNIRAAMPAHCVRNIGPSNKN